LQFVKFQEFGLFSQIVMNSEEISREIKFDQYKFKEIIKPKILKWIHRGLQIDYWTSEIWIYLLDVIQSQHSLQIANLKNLNEFKWI
jgi:hypothetical protein